jgi:hypothetical protein
MQTAHKAGEGITFAQRGDFAAVRAAEAALKAAGFSVGIMQAHAPRALFLGDCAISKWRNLSAMERLMADGEMHGGRDGPVQIVVSAGAGDDVLAAFADVRAAAAVDTRLTALVGGCVIDAEAA